MELVKKLKKELDTHGVLKGNDFESQVAHDLTNTVCKIGRIFKEKFLDVSHAVLKFADYPRNPSASLCLRICLEQDRTFKVDEGK